MSNLPREPTSPGLPYQLIGAGSLGLTHQRGDKSVPPDNRIPETGSIGLPTNQQLNLTNELNRSKNSDNHYQKSEKRLKTSRETRELL
ncbi:hypothetical protein OUZ56_030066 [Daphnia magna]|uniref:Uncharacterized protein n=1 Tax=Daphnia magna TaxID=35525 RepID=A0ABQ9ZQ74_9CRUS|nr:hypothetical protein OUZ56_030066 [Daphnia magna]